MKNRKDLLQSELFCNLLQVILRIAEGYLSGLVLAQEKMHSKRSGSRLTVQRLKLLLKPNSIPLDQEYFFHMVDEKKYFYIIRYKSLKLR